MATTLQPAMKKRQIIANSNRTMFVWVAIMSAVVGIAIVLGYFLVQQILFQYKVTAKLDDTSRTLSNNKNAASELIENVRVLETNAALNSSKAQPEEKALQVILDALPADANTLALGASLQQRLLAGVDGITIDSISVEPKSAKSSGETLPFTVRVRSASANSLKELLSRFERSIRVLDVSSLELERSESYYTMTIEARAYYKEAKVIELTQLKADKLK